MKRILVYYEQSQFYDFFIIMTFCYRDVRSDIPKPTHFDIITNKSLIVICKRSPFNEEQKKTFLLFMFVNLSIIMPFFFAC